MDWRAIRVPVPLAVRPQLVSVGRNRFQPGSTGRWKALNFWCFNLYRYEAELRVEGQEYPIRPGHASLIPPLAEMAYRFRTADPQLVAHHRYPAARASTPRTPLPLMIDLGADFERIWRAVEELVGWHGLNRLRAEVRLWDVLWEIAERTGSPRAGREELHPALQQVLVAIEKRLADPLRVEALAEEAGISQNHLTRLFQARFQTSVVGYIRRQRTERARLLLSATTQPIKAIAAQVGIPDLHLFNKVIRRELGDSPRRVRAKGRAL